MIKFLVFAVLWAAAPFLCLMAGFFWVTQKINEGAAREWIGRVVGRLGYPLALLCFSPHERKGGYARE